MKLRITLLLCCCPLAFLFAALEPTGLKCEYLRNPLGIDASAPRFAWNFINSGRDQRQTAYELIVSERIQDIQQGNGTAWSSGKQHSSQSVQVEYKGTPLRSYTRYYWRVRIYDQSDKPSAWSDVNWFETAMLDHMDWTASWIWDGREAALRPEDRYKSDPMPLFRKTFQTRKQIATARLYISGLGYYEVFLNGNKVGDHVLEPGWTAYGKQVLYSTYDITRQLKRGENIAGIMLGSGWWNPLPFKLFGRWDLSDYQQTGRPCVRAEIHITYADGSQDKVMTDQSWQTATGPVIRNNVYFGEEYDARLERKDWLSNQSFKEEEWKPSSIHRGPSGQLTTQMQPPIRVTKVIKPVGITEVGKDTFIVDLGQNFAGVVRIRVKGPSGTRITMRSGEGIFADGRINLMTAVTTQIKKGGIKAGRGAPETAWQEDNYILKGDKIETWSPRFTFHVMQYVEITGWPGRPTVNDIEGLRMNSDLATNGEFSCSNTSFNRLHEIIQWTFLSNVFSVQSDCPGREKMGYGADMVVSANAFLYNYNMAHFYGKSVRDFANDQRPLGGMTEIAPSTGIDDRGYGDGTGPLGWQLAFVHLQKQLYEFYGDRRIIETQYPNLEKLIAFLQSRATNNLFYWDISDHEALDAKPESLSASAFYFRHAQLAAEFAGILGKRDDSIRYDKLATSIRQSIIGQFLVRGTGRFDNATQSAQLFALWYQLTPEKEKSMETLLNEIKRHDDHLSTGIFGTEMLFDVLRREDKNEIAYRIANQHDYPGWLHMVDKGATTLWESWQFPETGASRNHPMFGSIDEWFYRSLLGINAAAPGFERIIIKPQPAGDLQWAKGSYESIRGRIVSSWTREGKNFTLQVTIPPNTSAEVWIPGQGNSKLTESGKEINTKRIEPNYLVVETGSGDYSFKVEAF